MQQRGRWWNFIPARRAAIPLARVMLKKPSEAA
jgi:hypothetical protein